MIAKISATENLGGALGYNFRKVNNAEATVLLASGLYQSPDGQYSMEQVLADMRQLIPDKCRTKKMVFHCSLNPHPDDKLTDDELCSIAKEYMEALGYGSQPYIVFRHNDIEREHIHIVSLRVDETGKKIDDRFEGARSKKITDAIEERYGLLPSTPQKASMGKVQNINTGNGDIRSRIAELMHGVLKHYRFCSLGELNALLSQSNMKVEEVKTEFRGKHYDGLVYVPTDSEGNKTGNPIHASDIARGIGFTAVNNRMEKSRKDLKRYLPRLREKVLEVMRSSPEDISLMNERLEKEGIHAFVRLTDTGRIYGITFIDEQSGIVANGSRLGKGYSANRFETYFSNGENPFLEDGYDKDKVMRQDKAAHKADLHPSDENTVASAEENLIEDLLSADIANEDWKEAAWQRKLRSQNKIRLRRGKR